MIAPNPRPPLSQDWERGPGGDPPPLTLPGAFYLRDVELVARELLGCVLVSRKADALTAGRIVETEAYGGPDDLASHASFRRNGLVRAMWGPAGRAYVYVAYGVYPCFNVVTGPAGEPAAVLIRALEPLAGIDVMRARLRAASPSRLASGPGKLSLALGITPADNEHPLDREPLWIHPGLRPERILSGPRIGITRDRDRPWRFGIAGHPALSRRF